MRGDRLRLSDQRREAAERGLWRRGRRHVALAWGRGGPAGPGQTDRRVSLFCSSETVGDGEGTTEAGKCREPLAGGTSRKEMRPPRLRSGRTVRSGETPASGEASRGRLGPRGAGRQEHMAAGADGPRPRRRRFTETRAPPPRAERGRTRAAVRGRVRGEPARRTQSRHWGTCAAPRGPRTQLYSVLRSEVL